MLLNEKINHVINLLAVSLAKKNQCLNYSHRSGNAATVLMVVHWFYYQFDMYIVSQFSICKIELFPLPNLLIKKKNKLSACCIKIFKNVGLRN